MGGKQHPYDLSPVFIKPCGVGFDHHPLFWRSGAGSHYIPFFVFHYAHPAGSVNGQLRMIAEGRKFYTGFPYDFQYVPFSFYGCHFTVYRHVFMSIHLHLPSYAMEMASSLQTPKHALHLIHLLLSITWAFLYDPPLMAFTGQTFLQRPQPTHFSSFMMIFL